MNHLAGSYWAYGLNFQSELPFPELLPGEGELDVTIQFGSVPERLQNVEDQGVLFQATPDRFLLKLDRIAHFLVQSGDNIIIQRAPQATDAEIRLFLLGSCLGALFHQRGLLVMHASAIQTERGTILFTGPSGNGKSTLLGALVERGYQMVSDDVTVVTTDAGGRIVVIPGYPQIKVWTDTAERLGKPVSSLKRLRPQLGKFALPARDNFSKSPAPLCAVYALVSHNEYGGEILMEALEDSARFAAIRSNTYRQRFLDGLGMRPVHFRLAAAAANAARVVRVTRPKQPFLLDELVDCIVEDLG